LTPSKEYKSMNNLAMLQGAANNQVMPGIGSANDIATLVKSLQAGQLAGGQLFNDQAASGGPLKVESLDKTLKVLTHTNETIRLLRRMPVSRASSTVEEFNQLLSYGNTNSGTYQEGELPQEEDSQYVRRAELVKFLGVTKSVSHPMTLVTPAHGAVIQREVNNGSLHVLKIADQLLTKGNSKVIPENFDGIYRLHEKYDGFATLEQYWASQYVIDLRGRRLGEADIEAAAQVIVDNFGLATDLFAPPKVLSNFVGNFYGNKFININSPQVSAGVVGQNVQAFESQYGRINMTFDVFMGKDATKKTTTGASSNRAPAAPTVSATDAVSAGATNSRWGAGDAGDYFYAVAAVNRYGISQITAGSSVTVAATGAVDITFTSGGGANPATGYIIYRSNEGAATAAAATFYPLFAVSAAELAAGYDGGAAGKIRDLNRILPDTDQCFLIQNNDEVHAMRQLAPLMKMDLSINSPAYRFMILYYITHLLFAPTKMVRFVNVGNATP
jgi:hypothetical protein